MLEYHKHWFDYYSQAKINILYLPIILRNLTAQMQW